MELAYSDLVQANLFYAGGPLLNFELPLFFLDRSDTEVSRTAWDALRDRARFYNPSDGDSVAWASNQITAFLRREQILALDMAKVIKPGRAVHGELAPRPGLLQRISRFDPGPIR